MNHYMGWRGIILATCIISSLNCLGQVFTLDWKWMFVLRLNLGMAYFYYHLQLHPDERRSRVSGPRAQPCPFSRPGQPQFHPGSAGDAMADVYSIRAALGALVGIVFHGVGHADTNKVCLVALGNRAVEMLLSMRCV